MEMHRLLVPVVANLAERPLEIRAIVGRCAQPVNVLVEIHAAARFRIILKLLESFFQSQVFLLQAQRRLPQLHDLLSRLNRESIPEQSDDVLVIRNAHTESHSLTEAQQEEAGNQFLELPLTNRASLVLRYFSMVSMLLVWVLRACPNCRIIR